jgi:hypothetical protein
MTEDRYMQWSGDPGLDKRIYELTTDNITRLKNLSDKFRVDVEREQCGAQQVGNTKEIAECSRAFIEKARATECPSNNIGIGIKFHPLLAPRSTRRNRDAAWGFKLLSDITGAPTCTNAHVNHREFPRNSTPLQPDAKLD